MAGRRMVVTGAARGIGAAIAEDLRSRGATVLTADVNPEGVDHRCDVSDPDELESLFVAAGGVHGLVNNAGLIVPRKPLGEITVEGARLLADPATYDTSATPLGRVTTPADLVGTVAFLLGADAAWVTGQTILVNGGRAVR